MLFAEYDRSSPIKNFTDRDRLNLHRELQVDDISYMIYDIMSQIYYRKYKKLCESGKIDVFFSVFSENPEGNQKFFECQSNMSSAIFFATIRHSFIKKVETWYPL